LTVKSPASAGLFFWCIYPLIAAGSNLTDNMKKAAILIVLLASVLGLGGCANFVAHEIVDAPNQSGGFSSSHAGRQLQRFAAPYFSEQAFVQVGPPPARLSVAVMPPADDSAYSIYLWYG
jgi:hypothetical protein